MFEILWKNVLHRGFQKTSVEAIANPNRSEMHISFSQGQKPAKLSTFVHMYIHAESKIMSKDFQENNIIGSNPTGVCTRTWYFAILLFTTYFESLMTALEWNNKCLQST
jgi:hypothetical protein